MLAALRRNRGIPAGKFEQLRDMMNKSVRDCLVTGHEPLIEGLKLPDPDDRHVLAAAIKAGSPGHRHPRLGEVQGPGTLSARGR